MQPGTDIAIIGAGAAGLMASVWAARTLRASGLPVHVAAYDGAARIGAKILVAGGGRCNVTHDIVTEAAYAGSSRHAVRNVLGRFGVADTVRFFAELGVELKREETGKLFPVTDDARSVLSALRSAVDDSGASVVHPWRVRTLRRTDTGFEIEGEAGRIAAKRVIVATGGKSLPRSGSDGAGYDFVKGLGHRVTETFPALVPLVLKTGHWSLTLPGLTLPATMEVRSGTGKRLVSFTDSTLFTHFGLSGPAVLDVSRYYSAARRADEGAGLFASWLPGTTREELDLTLQSLGKTSPPRALQEIGIPERMARALCTAAGIVNTEPGAALTREARRSLVDALLASPLPVVGDRGYTYAEVTAGGVPLDEVRLDTMESRLCPGLHLCGEILDVDGRIGGYNFQWAWASGFVAGRGAATPGN